MIKAVYQPQGVSSHLLAKEIGEKLNQKATHTGTLDPMAEGVLIVLTGDDRFKKQDLSDVKKTYQFEILWGISTDSLDLLGLITKNRYKQKSLISDESSYSKEIFSKKEKKSIEFLDNYLSKYVGKINQKMPRFSAKRIDGKSAFDLAKSGQKMKDFFNKVEIFEARVIEHSKISQDELEKVIIKKINNVEGNFRQQEVLESWKSFFANLKQGNKDDKSGEVEFYISKCEVKTSKRTYVRALVRDLGEDLQIPSTTFSIIRTQNGQYTIEDCS